MCSTANSKRRGRRPREQASISARLWPAAGDAARPQRMAGDGIGGREAEGERPVSSQPAGEDEAKKGGRPACRFIAGRGKWLVGLVWRTQRGIRGNITCTDEHGRDEEAASEKLAGRD